MRFFSINTFLVTGAMTIAACCCSGPKSISQVAIAAETDNRSQEIERDYLVKGMTCGGCVFGVKKALERTGLSKNQILEVDYRKPDPDHQIGHAKVKFQKDQYTGLKTDCKIIKEIRDNPGYVAYLDSANMDPCKLGN